MKFVFLLHCKIPKKKNFIKYIQRGTKINAILIFQGLFIVKMNNFIYINNLRLLKIIFVYNIIDFGDVFFDEVALAKKKKKIFLTIVKNNL